MPTTPQIDPNMTAAIGILASARAMAGLVSGTATDDAKRNLLADLCREIAPRRITLAETIKSRLSPRLSQTLRRLLAGDSEKQIASSLQLSPHTVHVYVKSLYKAFTVSSRGELLALFVSLRSR